MKNNIFWLNKHQFQSNSDAIHGLLNKKTAPDQERFNAWVFSFSRFSVNDQFKSFSVDVHDFNALVFFE